MSYILDALKRADSERERGKVPSLHANPTPADRVDGDDDLGGTAARPWPLLAAGLGLGLLGVLAWQYLTPREAPPVSPPPPPTATAAVAPPTVAPPAPIAAPLPAPTPPPTPAPVAVAAQPAPAPVARPTPPVPAVPSTAAKTAPAVAPTAAPPDARVLALAELPEATRRQLPPLATGGAMYSDTPSQRMLIINGQVLREGDRVTAELVLERIELKSAVLAFKGQRLRISY